MKLQGLILLLLSFFLPPQEKSVLDLEICHIRSHEGVILISIYTSENQYPYHPYKSIEIKKDSLSGECLHTSIRDLSPGIYGLCLLDDENRSGQMDYNILGIPKEGFGFANNVKTFLRRPDYNRILFRLGPGKNSMKLTVKYK
jgi:uncharacterized protein (DUF2141 family)